MKRFYSYQEAKQQLQLIYPRITSGEEYKKLKREGKLSEQFPSDPLNFYRRNVHVNFLTYPEFKKLIKKLGIKNSGDYRKLRNKRNDLHIPNDPKRSYDKEWEGWDKITGFPNRFRLERDLVSFEEAKKIVQKAKVTGSNDFVSRKFKNIPLRPYLYYKEWKSWEDFLNYKRYLDFKDARNKVIKLGIKDQGEFRIRQGWHKGKKDPRLKQIPSHPDKVYKKDWVSWNHFVGKKEKIEYAGYEECVKIIKKLGIKSAGQYWREKKSGKIPNIVPPNPAFHFKKRNKWKTWTEFFGNKPINIVSYEEAKKQVIKSKVTTHEDYVKKIKKGILKDVPRNPSDHYKGKGWVNWAEYIGLPRKIMSYEQAKRYVRRHFPKGMVANEWHVFIKKNRHLMFNSAGTQILPSRPDYWYKRFK